MLGMTVNTLLLIPRTVHSLDEHENLRWQATWMHGLL